VIWRERSRRAAPFLIVSASGLALAWIIVALFLFPSSAVADEGPVPNMIGLTWADAAARLGAAGFKAARGEARYHASAPPSTILSQNPPAGSVQTKGTTVILDVSRGQRRATVPSVTGMTREQASAALVKAGFDLGDVTEQESQQPRGAVLASSPVAGQVAVLPSSVNLAVSRGPADVGVPDLLMQNVVQARLVLEQLGFTVGTVTFDSTASEPPGSVIGQSPASGQRVPGGSKVDLKIAGRELRP
jgi:eukaryotic-like serine/threonine-protein kinase